MGLCCSAAGAVGCAEAVVFCCCVALFSLVTDWDFLLRWIMEMLMRERPPPPLLFLLEEGEA